MQRRFGPVLLILFACLQCLAPLLHAHAAEGQGHGVHLPALQSAAVAGEAMGEGWRNDHPPIHADQTIGVASSLEARQDGPPLETPGLPGRFPLVVLSGSHACLQGPDPDSGYSRFSYLVPDACAPPRI